MPDTHVTVGPPMGRWLAVLHASGGLVIAFVLVASLLGVSDLYRWTADVSAIPGARPYEGLLSNLGVIVWASAFAVALFTGLTTFRLLDSPVPRLLIGGAIVTFVLLVDDLFTLHDTLLPEYVGIPETIATVLVGLVPLAFLWVFRRVIPQTPWLMLAIGVAYLAVMTGIDFVENRTDIPGHHLWEEGAKFLGILHWCGYLVCTSALVIMNGFRTPAKAETVLRSRLR